MRSSDSFVDVAVECSGASMRVAYIEAANSVEQGRSGRLSRRRPQIAVYDYLICGRLSHDQSLFRILPRRQRSTLIAIITMSSRNPKKAMLIDAPYIRTKTYTATSTTAHTFTGFSAKLHCTSSTDRKLRWVILTHKICMPWSRY